MADDQFQYVVQGGKSYKVPADAKPAQISKALGAVPIDNAKHVPPNTPTWADIGNDVIAGAVKGLANTTRSAVSLIPGVEPAARAAGNYLGGKAGEMIYGQKAEPVTREAATESLKPQGDAQKLGYTAEQIGEFFVPAGAARKGVIEGLVRAIPNSASAATMKALNKGAAIAGRTIGEAGSAGTVAALQGAENPALAAGMAAAGPLVGAGGEALAASKYVKMPITKNLLGIIGGTLGAQALGGVTPASLGAGMATFALTRQAAKTLLAKPGVMQRIGGLARTGSEEAARLLAAITAVAAEKEED